MTTVNWAQLTPDERATLNYFCKNGTPATMRVADLPAAHDTLDDYGLMTFDQTDTGVWVDVTPAGLLVWQQGQVASVPPRSVWVAEKGADEDRDILSVHTTEAGAKAACQRDWERHIETRSHLNYPKTITWKQFDWGGDGSGYYVSQSGPYYVGQYPLVDDAE